jgi:hypothetical protein
MLARICPAWPARDRGHRGLGYASRSLSWWSRSVIDPPRTLSQAGAPSPVIAVNLGHSSTSMVEAHYAHLVPSHVAQVICATMPKLRFVEPSPAVSPTTMLQRVRSQQARASAGDANPSGYEMPVGTQRGGRPV